MYLCKEDLGFRRHNCLDWGGGGRSRNPPETCMSVSCECCVLLSKRFCDVPTECGESEDELEI